MELIEPAAPSCDRGDQERAVLRNELGGRSCARLGCGQEDLAAPCWMAACAMAPSIVPCRLRCRFGSSIRSVGQFDDQLIRLDLDPRDVGLRRGPRPRSSADWLEVVSNRSIWTTPSISAAGTRLTAPARSGWPCSEGGGEIVAVLDGPFAAWLGVMPMAAVIEETSNQQGL